MTDSEIDLFLQREICENKNVVTFRLLSRKLSIHVNAAKNALASFYAQKRENLEPVYATFWISGETVGRQMSGAGDETGVDDEDDVEVQTRKVILVGEEDLERTKSTFSKVTSLHVYALSTSPLDDTSQLCGPSKEVQKMDTAGGNELAAIVGKVTNQHIKRVTSTKKLSRASSSAKPQASTSKPANTPTMTKLKIDEKKPQAAVSPAPSEKENPKTAGKLDWSKAKAKTKEVKKEPPTAGISVKLDDVRKASTNERQRELKRKSSTISQKQEEELAETKPDSRSSSKLPEQDSSGATRIKKGVVLSDDEDEQDLVRIKSLRKGKSKAIDDDSDAERSLRAMMDIDDSEVIKARSATPQVSRQGKGDDAEEPPTPQDDTAMDEDSDDPAPKTKPRKRKEKKVIPTGRNGYKKKRVLKSKTDFDEKGYMVTVDYSSYESVDDDEAEAEKDKEALKSKSKDKKQPVKRKPSVAKRPAPSESESEAKAPAQNKAPVSAKKSEAKKTTTKPTAAKNQVSGGQKSLKSFFGGGGAKVKK